MSIIVISIKWRTRIMYKIKREIAAAFVQCLKMEIIFSGMKCDGKYRWIWWYFFFHSSQTKFLIDKRNAEEIKILKTFLYLLYWIKNKIKAKFEPKNNNYCLLWYNVIINKLMLSNEIKLGRECEHIIRELFLR